MTRSLSMPAPTLPFPAPAGTRAGCAGAKSSLARPSGARERALLGSATCRRGPARSRPSLLPARARLPASCRRHRGHGDPLAAAELRGPPASDPRFPAAASAPAPDAGRPGRRSSVPTPQAWAASLRRCCAPTASWAAAGSRLPPPSRCSTRPAAPSWAGWLTAGRPRPAPQCAPPTTPSAAGGASRPR